MVGWYSVKQYGQTGGLCYTLVDADVTPEARASFVTPIDVDGERAVWITQVSENEDHGAAWPDMVRVGQVGRYLKRDEKAVARSRSMIWMTYDRR